MRKISLYDRKDNDILLRGLKIIFTNNPVLKCNQRSDTQNVCLIKNLQLSDIESGKM